MSTLATALAQAKASAPTRGLTRWASFAVLLHCSVAIFFFGCNYFEIFLTNHNLNFQLFLAVSFVAVAIVCRRTERLNRYWQLAFAFFTAAAAMLVSTLFGGWNHAIVIDWLGVMPDTSQWQAVDKLYEVLMVVVPLLVLTKLSGADLGVVYLKRGNLKWGLGLGGLVWFNFVASAFLFYAMRFTSTGTLGAAVLWGLVFSCANSFMEELWLRGIFLRRLEPFLGVGGSVLVTSIAFALLHGGAVYLTPIAVPFMVANTFTLGLACGYLTMKTDSLWGAWLIHAASDLFLFIALLASA